ncbi:MAG: MMPL family transporter [Myxococcota bacterium]
MKRAIASRLAALIVTRPVAVAVVIGVLVTLAGIQASRLYVNHNQLDMLPQDLPAVEATKEITRYIGGVGFLMLALRADDEAHLKAVSDALAEKIEAMPEVRHVTHKQDVSFVRERIGLLADTDDVKEAYRRIRKKVKAILAANNPFHIELVETKDEPLVLDDIIEKYTKLNKKSITDPYYIDDAKEMLMVLIKPKHPSEDLASTRALLEKLNRFLADFNANNDLDATLKEGYDGVEPGSTVTYGFTGTYKTNVDDSDSIMRALAPSSLVAFGGILLYVLIFLRSFSASILLMLTLVAATVMTFGFAQIAIGELNTITAILGAILMGLGIDFGIHLLYRLREEYTESEDIELSIARTLEHSGAASAASALTTSAALYVLVFAHLTAFVEFGIIMGTGVLIQMVMMYVTIPTLYVILSKIRPDFLGSLRTKKQNRSDRQGLENRRFPYARAILAVSVLLTAALAYFATNAEFDYDSRSLMATNNPALKLREEMRRRFQISSDPVGIYTKTLDESLALFQKLTPVSEDSMIESVVSINALVPPQEEQRANQKYLKKLERMLVDLDPSALEAEQEGLSKKLEQAMPYLRVEPFTVDEVPSWILWQLKPVPESNTEGWMTYIYPKTTLWDGRELLKFADEVDEIEVDGTTYHSAGAAVLMAQVASYVLNDGRLLTGLAAGLIFVILLLSFQRFSAALFSVLPLVAGLVWMLGLMTIFDYQLNFMNVVVFPVVFGYGISAGIHVYSRYVESGSVMLAVRRTGAAVAASSLTTLVGWGALFVSSHRGLISMGMLACLGIASSLLVSLTVLPALLEVMGGRGDGPGTKASTEPASELESAPVDARRAS